MSDRSTLQFRVRPHSRPGRQEDVVVEVLRDGEVAATIYGSREGVHIVSERLEPDSRNIPFSMIIGDIPSWVIPLLKADEECPWCSDGSPIRPCPVCRREATE